MDTNLTCQIYIAERPFDQSLDEESCHEQPLIIVFRIKNVSSSLSDIIDLDQDEIVYGRHI
jgi:hypothetical protein